MNNVTFNLSAEPCIKSFGSCPDPNIIIPVVQKFEYKKEIQMALLGVVALLIVVDLVRKWR